MFNKINLTILAVLLMLILAMRVIFWLNPVTIAPTSDNDDSTMATGSISTGERTIPVSIAASVNEKAIGLSGRQTLAPDSGMLFLFDHSERFGFWMPDMHFAIDMIWVDEDWRVVDVTHHATPESYPKLFYPNSPARYVLEVNDGKASEWGIASGSVLMFKQ